ncbi:fructosamine kinase family protein [Reichenbachiella sp. MALMAid0571]|uniref:fructosamine kinase family protein n=1 Tax=Reichenbachiella sp. MALMAid0571 TaxID=3143939 RepID=UPI0032DFDAF9
MVDFFQSVLTSALGKNDVVLRHQPIGGGCINQAVRLTTVSGNYFLKWNKAQVDMFEKESLGLKLLSKSGKVSIPKVYQSGELEGKGYLLMEYIEPGKMDRGFWQQLGNGLAEMHKSTNAQFGLNHDNYIGRLYQKNTFHADWVDFFINCRLIPQIKLARNAGLISTDIVARFETLYLQLNDLMPVEKPALLHGDLWSGNIHCDQEKRPYLIDPAVYYGHREAELAFTQLFGGFDELFYNSYENTYPLMSGFDSRVDLFNLYPLLVHLNLFGSSYLGSIVNTLKKFA